MAAPVRQCIVDLDASYPERWKANGAAFLWTQRLYFSQYAAAATTGNFDISGFPGLAVIEGAWVLLSQNFTGGAVATSTFSVGTTASPALYVAATTVFATAATKTAPTALVGLTLVPGTYLGTAAAPASSATIRTQVVTTVGNTNVLTAGQLDLYVRLRFTAYRAK
jgi:hypothetical protein